MAKRSKSSKKKEVNKSAAIRKYLATRPNTPPKDVRQALGKKGIDVSEALVSNVKFNLKQKKTATRGRSGGRSRPSDDIKQAGQLMYQAIDLVVKAGAKEARQLVDVATNMVSKINDGK